MLFAGILALGLVMSWLQFVAERRIVQLDPVQGHVTIKSMSLAFRQRIRTYSLSVFQSVYSYPARYGHVVVLYSFDKQELFLTLRGEVLHGKGLFSDPLDSPEVAALRQEIARKCDLKDAGFFGRLMAPSVQMDD